MVVWMVPGFVDGTVFMKYQRILVMVLAAAALVAVGGCFGGGLKTYEVTGTVTLNGEPLQSVNVEFWPEMSGGMRSFGKTDEKGFFTLKTDDAKSVGATPGKHRVLLRDTWYMRDYYLGDNGDWVAVDNGERSRIDFVYYDPERSPLKVDVVSGKNHFDFTPDPLPTGRRR
jgi:hypothetical protein